MICQGDRVRRKKGYVEGTVLRTNWSNMAEVKWDGPSQAISMHDVSELEKIDYAQEKLDSIYSRIPELHNMALIDGEWKISKPIASPSLRFWRRIKNSWLVLTGRAFVIRWF